LIHKEYTAKTAAAAAASTALGIKVGKVAIVDRAL